MVGFTTRLYYIIATSFLETGASDKDCLELAWCLQELSGEFILQEELQRTAEEAAGLMVDCFGLLAGTREEHKALLEDLTPDNLYHSETFKDAVSLVYEHFALGIK